MLKIKVEGYQEAKEILDELPNNMQKKMLRTALKKSSRPFVKGAQSRVPVKTGQLKKQLKVVSFRDRQAPKTEVDVAVKHVFSRSKKKKAVNEYYGKFVHKGTSDPRTPRRKDRVLAGLHPSEWRQGVCPEGQGTQGQTLYRGILQGELPEGGGGIRR